MGKKLLLSNKEKWISENVIIFKEMQWKRVEMTRKNFEKLTLPISCVKWETI